MARKANVAHVVTSGKTKFSVKEPDIYTNIADIVGVKLLADTDTADFRTTVNELRINGVAIHISVRTETNKVHTVLCTTEKAAKAVSGLINKTIGEFEGDAVVQKKITSVTIPRKRSRS
jgi:hypothetical protein